MCMAIILSEYLLINPICLTINQCRNDPVTQRNLYDSHSVWVYFRVAQQSIGWLLNTDTSLFHTRIYRSIIHCQHVPDSILGCCLSSIGNPIVEIRLISVSTCSYVSTELLFKHRLALIAYSNHVNIDIISLHTKCTPVNHLQAFFAAHGNIKLYSWTEIHDGDRNRQYLLLTSHQKAITTTSAAVMFALHVLP